jgi:hypothetical protein
MNLTVENMTYFNDLGDTKRMVQEVDFFDITYTFFAEFDNPFKRSNLSEVWEYRVIQHFDCTSPGLVKATLEILKLPQDDGVNILDDFYTNFMHCLCLFLAAVSLLLNLRHYINLRSTFNSINKKYDLLENGFHGHFVHDEDEGKSTKFGKNDSNNLSQRLTDIKS